MQIFLKAVTNWPIIIQGALGSALFWIILEIITLLVKAIARAVGRHGQTAKSETRIREYIYRKYTSRTGLVNYTQGFFLTFDHVFKYLLYGLIFTCVALIISGFGALTYGICLTAALYFFLRGILWLTPSPSWHSSTLADHWKRVGELETILFGHIDDDTKEWIDKFTTEEKKVKR